MNQQPPTPATPPAALGAFCPRALLLLLWDRALPHLTREECQWVGDGFAEFANQHTARLGVVLSGLACLVACDTQAGYHQSQSDVADLLFLQADLANMLSGMGYAADGALAAVAYADYVAAA